MVISAEAPAVEREQLIVEPWGFSRGQFSVSYELTEELLATAYLRYRAEDLLKIIFYEGEPSLTWFLDWSTRPTNHYLGGFMRPGLDKDPLFVGMGWFCQETNLNEGELIKSEVGMGFFRDYQRAGITVPVGRLMLDVAFERMGFDSLFGTTPVQNRAALAYARKLGFGLSGPIPDYTLWEGKPTGVMISHMTRAMWDESLVSDRKEETYGRSA